MVSANSRLVNTGQGIEELSIRCSILGPWFHMMVATLTGVSSCWRVVRLGPGLFSPGVMAWHPAQPFVAKTVAPATGFPAHRMDKESK